MVEEASIYIITASVIVLGLTLFTVVKTKQMRDKVEFLLYEINERDIQVGTVDGIISFATSIVSNYFFSRVVTYIGIAICLVSPWIYYTRLHSSYSIVVGLLLILFTKTNLGGWKSEYDHLVRLYYASVARESNLSDRDSPFDLVDSRYIVGERYKIDKSIYKGAFIRSAIVYGILILLAATIWSNATYGGQE